MQIIPWIEKPYPFSSQDHDGAKNGTRMPS